MPQPEMDDGGRYLREGDTHPRMDVDAVKSVRAGRGAPRGERGGSRDSHTLIELGWTLFENRWAVVTVAVTVLALAAVYLFLAKPIYRSSVLMQVDEDKKSLLGLEEVSAVFLDATPAETRIQIMRSQSLLGAVVDELSLDIVARPRALPVVGAAIARRHRGPDLAPPRFGLTRFAWGGERIRVARLTVPDELLGEPLVLTVRGESRYQLAADDGTALLAGEVGRLARGDVVGGQVELLVSELVARPGTQMLLAKLSRADVVERLQQALQIEEKGKKTGVVAITLDGPDPARVAAILRAVSETYVRQNVERKSAEAAKTLEFLESQLPSLKSNLDKAEAALSAFQLKKGRVNLPLETQSTLELTAEIEKALAELEAHRSELRQRYTDTHPDVATVEEKIGTLQEKRALLNERLRKLPESELETARLTRNVKVATDLYLHLLNKAQELRVSKSGMLGDVHIVDRALVPTRPVSPKRGAVLAVALLLGLGAGIAAALARKALQDGAADPDEIELATGLPVFAAVPHSDTEAELARAGCRGSRRLAALSLVGSGDAAVEDLRTLRTSVQFALLGSRNGVVAIGGPAPRVGKSFVCLNLAHLSAAAGRRVLLVDADLRRGILHRYFGLEPRPGLADVASGAATLDAAIRHTDVQRLDLLATGPIPPNPAELLESPSFQQVLAEAARQYDVVVVDTPPILSVTDAALVARHAGVNLLVLRAGQHPAREIALALKRFAHSGVTVQGAILNDVRASGGRYGRYGGYRRYDGRSSPRV